MAEWVVCVAAVVVSFEDRPADVVQAALRVGDMPVNGQNDIVGSQ